MLRAKILKFFSSPYLFQNIAKKKQVLQTGSIPQQTYNIESGFVQLATLNDAKINVQNCLNFFMADFVGVCVLLHFMTISKLQ